MKKSSTRPAWSQTLALEPRMMFDAAAVATATEVADAQATATTAPDATATPASDAVYTIDKNGVVGADAHLFSNADVSADSEGNEITKLVVTVSTTGTNQALVIDGTSIALTTTSATQETDNSHYSYNVDVADGKTTITLFLSNNAEATPQMVETLIDGISYRALDSDVSSGEVTVTLKSIADDSDTTALDISATVTIDNNKNLAPSVDYTADLALRDDLTVADLADSATQVGYSSDGNFAYVASSDGTVLVYAVSDTGGLTKIQTLSGLIPAASEDDYDPAVINGIAVGDNAVYLLYGSSVMTLSRDSDGKVSLTSTDGIGDTSVNIALSSDGKNLYISSEWNGIYVYDIASDGTLTQVEESRFTENTDRSAGIAVAGDYLFVMARGSTSLTVLQRTVVDGVTKLVVVDNLPYGSQSDYESLYQLAVSSDGSKVYTLNTVTGELVTWRFDGSQLTQIDSRTVDSASDIAISSDNGQLYVSTSDGTLYRYKIGSDGALTEIASQTTGGSLALVVSGTSLLVVGGNSIERYSSELSYTVGSDAIAVAETLTLADSNSDVLNSGAGNYAGASITITASDDSNSQFTLQDANGLSVSGTQLLLDGVEIGSFVTSGNSVTIAFTADVSTETANQVLHQVLWASSGVSTALVTLTVVANDGQLDSQTQTVSVRVNQVPALDESVVDGYTLPVATSETGYSEVLPELFKDSDGDNLTWTVTGLPDGLTFDAETRTISGSTTETGSFTLTITVKDTSGATSSTSLEMTVEQIDNRDPVKSDTAPTALTSAVISETYSLKLDASMFSDPDAVYGDSLSWQVSGLPDGLTFDAATLTISGTATTLGDSVITITVTDESGKTAEAEVALRVITQAEMDNTAPALNPEASTLVYSSDGSLSGYSYYIGNMTISADGETLVVVGSTGGNYSGTIYVSIYSRDTSSGELTLQTTYTQGTADDGNDSNGIEVDGLTGTTNAVFSADGSTLYLSGTNSSGKAVVQSFSLDADSGKLTLISSAEVVATVTQLKVSADGSSVYAMSSTGLYRYSVDSDGKLTVQESFSDITSALSLGVDGNGTVYVFSSSGAINVYTPDSNGALTLAGKLTRSGTALTWTDKDGNTSSAGTLSSSSGLNGPYSSMVVSQDGYLYVMTGTNAYLTVLHYDADSNSISLVSSRSTYSDLNNNFSWSIAISDDGSALYIGSNGAVMAIYDIGSDGNVTLRTTLKASGALVTLTVSPDGKSVYGGSRYINGLRQFSGSAEAIEVSWTEGSSTLIASQLVLSDVDYDAANSGAGNYNGATITIARDGDDTSADSYSLVEGNGLTLKDGKIYLNDVEIATFSETDGKLTVTFTADVTTAVANQVLHQISWQSSTKTPAETLAMTVSISDQYVTTSQAVTVKVTQVNDAPELSSQATNPTYSDTSATVTVFKDTVIDTIESGQTILGLTLTVSGLVSGESDYLVIDGKTVSLTDGVRVITNNSLVISVSVSDGVATVEITSLDGMTTAAAQTLVDGIAYGNSDAYSGTHTVALTQVRDSGGTENGSSDSSTFSITSTITLQAQDMPPKLVATENNLLELADSLSAVSGLGTLTQTVLSADGASLYVTDGSGTVALFSRDTTTGELTWSGNMSTGLGSISSITLTSDGLTAIITSTSDNSLSVFSRATDGALTLLESHTIWNIKAITLSSDGSSLYVIDEWSGLTVFSRDATTGKLTEVQQISYDSSEPYLFSPLALETAGSYLYVITDPVYAGSPNSLLVYQRQEDGTLQLVASLYDSRTDASGATMDLSAPTTITVSDDGSQIYVINNGNLNIYAFNQSSGKLLQVDTLENIGTVNALALSADNTELYVLLAEGSLQVYSISSAGVLSLSKTYSSADYAALSGATSIQTSSDGALIISGSQVASLIPASDELRYTVGGGTSSSFTDGVVLSDKVLDGLNNGAGNYGGASITVKDDSGLGSFSFSADSQLTLDDNGQLLDNGTVIGTVTQQDGVLTVTFADGVTTATANNVLASLTYSNTNLSTGSQVTLSVTASDGQLTSSSWQRTLTINHAPQTTDSDYQPATVTKGVPVSLTLPEDLFSDLDGDDLQWAVSGLPAGYTFDATTRTISGAATTAGEYTLTISVTDGDGATASRELTIHVNTAPQAGEGSTTFSQPVGEPVNIVLADSLFVDADGDALSWQFASLPDGLSFDAETHTLSGDLAAGRYSLVLTVTDAWGASFSRTLVLNIVQPQSTNGGVGPVILPRPPQFTAEDNRDDERFWRADAPPPPRPAAMPGAPIAPAGVAEGAAFNTVAATGGTVLASGALNYQETPWALTLVMSSLMPALERVNFTTRSADSDRLARTTAWSGVWQDSGNDQQVFRLPQGLQSGSGFVAVQLANGRPLPAWIQFDARRGELRISSADAARSGQIQLRLQRADGAPALVLTLRDGRAVTTASASDASLHYTTDSTSVVTPHAPDITAATVTASARPADALAFNQGISHSLAALRGDSDDLLQALSALAQD
ncbi:putative Ig domain-containing protein [Erwinia sp. V71]|uniref:putative Ig domain-containing protein n=1 Tax=Erwinia sp. V71 TaxID=3369424 RepID=UPI003F5F6463